MSIDNPVIGTQQISVAEAVNGGLGSTAPRKLEEEDKKKVERFVSAHTNTSQAPNGNTTGAGSSAPQPGVATARTASAEPQVSATEQQNAVLESGNHDRSKTQKNGRAQLNKLRALYKAIFPASDSFVDKDMLSLLESVRSKSKCLVDLTRNLSEPEKALRKYVLVELLLTKGDTLLTKTDHANLSVLKLKLISAHGEFISSTIAAYEIARAKALSGPSLREYIKAYQVHEIKPESNSAEELSELFQVIKPRLNEKNILEKLDSFREGYVQLLTREKRQDPSRASSPRQHLILSRINQLTTIMRLSVMHNSFLKTCAQAKITGLPTNIALLEQCLYTVASDNVLSGMNGLIALAAGVKSDRAPAKNNFISLYARWVLQHPAVAEMYRNPMHKKLVLDNLEKSVQAGAILSIGKSTTASTV